MLLLIDNFDSFTHNLVQYFYILGEDVEVVRNNTITVDECIACDPDYIVISPGPGTPEQAGITKEVIRQCAGKIPLLGICLGMQAIAEVYGAKVICSGKPVHGKTSQIYHSSEGIFCGIPQNFEATRYHSLIVEESSVPSCLEVTATSADGCIMGLRHRGCPIEGVQFHPESILTKAGLALLQNFLDYSYENLTLEGAKYV